MSGEGCAVAVEAWVRAPKCIPGAAVARAGDAVDAVARAAVAVVPGRAAEAVAVVVRAP